jgi:protein SCO1/2
MIVLLLLFALLSQPARASGPDLGDIGFTQRPGAPVPVATTLRTASGRPITLQAAMAGRPSVLAFGWFRCPTLCGIVRADLLAGLAQSGLRLGADYTLLAVSIDPAESPADASEIQAREAARYALPGDAGAAYYLTGDALPLEEAVGLHARFDAATKQFLHPAGLVFLTPDGIVSGYLLGVGYQPDQLRAGIRRARAGTIAPVASPILLLCFHFDPATGRYTLAIMQVVRLLAGIAVLAIGSTIALALRRERR